MFRARARARFIGLGLLLSLGVARPETRAAEEPVRLAVIEFESATVDKDLAPLGKGLQSMLTTDLTGLPGVQVMERQQLKEILGELALGRSGPSAGLMDRSTVAKIGKLAGANRLLGGSFTLVGGKMRLDGRLYVVETGEVLTATSIDGDKDAFFELEKKLAGKVVEALGLVLQPKQRAALARVQTADFAAFQSFSRGLAAFDEKRYQDALAALGEAMQQDKDFTLAARTRDDYQKIIGELRGRATSMTEVAEAKADVRGHTEQAARNARWGPTIEELWKLVAKAGAGPAQLDRLAATLLLAVGYESRFGLQSPRGDRFALDRTADELEKRYFQEAKGLFPRIPPFVALQLYKDPKPGEPVAEWVRRTSAAMEDAMTPAHRAPISRDEDELGKRLQLDGKARLRLAEQIATWNATLAGPPSPGPGIRDPYASLDPLAEKYRDALELQRSTAAFAAHRKQATDAWAVNRIANEIETNERLVALVTEAQNPFVKESLLLGGGPHIASLLTSGPAPADEGLKALGRLRALGEGNLMYVDSVPVWLVHEGNPFTHDVETGPRSEKFRTSELRYFTGDTRLGRDGAREALIVTGAGPRNEGSLSFHVSFTPAADFWRLPLPPDPDAAKPPERPDVGVAFGIQSATGVDPTAGYVLLIGAHELEVARFVLTKTRDSSNKKRTELVTTTMTKVPAEGQGLTGNGGDVSVRFGAKAAEVTLAGHKTSIAIPTERNGFQGLFFRAPGYAAVSHLAQK